ncbi:MAG TPA: CARDB domain-containing protein [Candidatus Acidoferrales bacterium]|nr:CARDB domain-containing protein [Candidatus Acidoferrales bacterium]
MLAAFAGGSWSAPEAVPNLPAGAYTPSLAFDRDDNPVLAFVVPAVQSQTGRLGTGDGNNSQLYAARRGGDTWQVGVVGDKTDAERPTVRVTADNHAILFYRRFGTATEVHRTGDLAAAVADLNASTLAWTTAFLTADGQTNWEVAFDLDGQTGKSFVVDTKETPSGATAASSYASGGLAAQDLAPGNATVTSFVVPFAVDLALTASDIAFSNPHPLGGFTVNISVRVHNQGLKPTDSNTPVTVDFYDGDVFIGNRRITTVMPFNGTAVVSVPYTLPGSGLHAIRVVVDEQNVIAESDETNNEATAVLGQVPAPSNLGGFTLPRPGQRPTLRWDAPQTAGIQGYRIFRSTTAGAGYELVGATTATSFVDDIAQPGTTYFYIVVAVDTAGVTSPASNEAQVASTAPPCVGDCDQSGAVTVDELLTGVDIALGELSVDRCAAFDADRDGRVTVDEILAAVNNALTGCPTQ